MFTPSRAHKLYFFISLTLSESKKKEQIHWFIWNGQRMLYSFWVNIDFDEQLVLICFIMKTYWDNKVLEQKKIHTTRERTKKCMNKRWAKFQSMYHMMFRFSSGEKQHKGRIRKKWSNIQHRLSSSTRQMHPTPLSHCAEELVLFFQCNVTINSSRFRLLKCFELCTLRD